MNLEINVGGNAPAVMRGLASVAMKWDESQKKTEKLTEEMARKFAQGATVINRSIGEMTKTEISYQTVLQKRLPLLDSLIAKYRQVAAVAQMPSFSGGGGGGGASRGGSLHKTSTPALMTGATVTLSETRASTRPGGPGVGYPQTTPVSPPRGPGGMTIGGIGGTSALDNLPSHQSVPAFAGPRDPRRAGAQKVGVDAGTMAALMENARQEKAEQRNAELASADTQYWSGKKTGKFFGDTPGGGGGDGAPGRGSGWFGGTQGNAASQAMGAFKFAAAMHVISSSAEAVGNTLKNFDNKYTTNSEAAEKSLKELPLGLGAFATGLYNSIDAISGFNRTMQNLGEQNAGRIASVGAAAAYEPRIKTGEFAAAQAEFRGQRDVGAPIGRTTAGRTRESEIAYQTAETRAPALARQQEAAADVIAARKTKSLADADYAKAQAKRVGSAHAFDVTNWMLQEHRRDPGTGNRDRIRERDKELVTAGQTASIRQAQAAQEAEDALNRKKQSGLDLVQAESQVRKANIDLSKADLAVMEAKEKRMTTAARSLGRMNPAEQAAAAQALRAVKERGIENVAPWQREQARAIAPDLVGKAEEQVGARFAEEHGLGALAPGDIGGRGDIERIRADVAAKKVEVQLMVRLDEKTLAKEIAAVLKDWVKEVGQQAERAKQEAQNEALRQQQQRGAG